MNFYNNLKVPILMEQRLDCTFTQQYSQNDPVIKSIYSLCLGDQTPEYICSSKNCLYTAIICAKQDCVCHKNHQQCNDKIQITSLINKINSLKKPIQADIRHIFNQVIQQYDRIIQIFSEERIQFIEFVQTFGLSSNSRRIANIINDGKANQIKGQLINKVWKQLIIQPNEIYIPQSIKCLEQFQKCTTKIVSSLNKLSFQLANSQKRVQKAILKFGQKNIQAEQIWFPYKHLDFIPIQLTIYSNLKGLNFNQNDIRKIENLQNKPKLRQIRLAYNRIQKIQNLPNSLIVLTLTSNKIKKIENLDHLLNLQKLYLGNNQIQEMDNFSTLVQLKYLSLSFNKISVIKNIEQLVNLKQFWIQGNPLKSDKQIIEKMVQKGIKVIYKQ